jgi:hypothetical protein
MSEHDLKVWSSELSAMLQERKRFEWRKDDRDFQEGDYLFLREWNPAKNCYVDERGQPINKEMAPVFRYRVTYILRGRFGVPDGYVIMSVSRV